jgi:hypothetical protein
MSTGEPSPSEVIRDVAFDELFRGVCARPSMYVQPATFATVCAFIDGFDTARNGGPLRTRRNGSH